MSIFADTLTEFTITNTSINILDIISKVKKNLDSNYNNENYSMHGHVKQVSSNNDVVILDVDNDINVRRLKNQKNLGIEINEKKINVVDTFFINSIGLVFMSINQLITIDFLKKKMMFKNSEYKKYSYKLTDIKHDSLLGELYVIHFSPYKNNYRYSFDYFTAEMSGDLLVRKEDYAIISVSYEVNRNVKLLRKYAMKYSKGNSNFLWKTLPSEERIVFFCSYSKDTSIGKYFLSRANYTFYENGKLLDNNQPIQLIEYLHYDRLN